ncbi:hypothetical protein PspLS_10315 [Pyricularia sp. CBS 133598]|nr:hypothetical protein PspLS_10315 [Pyricularia sp. CBS 133598]
MRNVKQTIILAPLAAAALVASAPLSSHSANINFEGGDSLPPSVRETLFRIDGGMSAPLSARDATFKTNREVAAVVPLSLSFPPPSPGLVLSKTQPRLGAREEPAAAAVPETSEQNVQDGGYKPDKGMDEYKQDKKEKKKEALKKVVGAVAQTAVEVGLKAYQAAKSAKDKKKESKEGGYGYGGGKESGGKGYGEKMVDVEVPTSLSVEA